jgi:coproporphyrinogen III oxidase
MERPEGGGGRTRNRERKSFEKGGVNISAVHKLPEAMQKMFGVGEADFLPADKFGITP